MPTVNPILIALMLGILIAPGLSWAEGKAPRSLFDWSTQWSERKYHRRANQADKAFYRKQWQSAIKLGESALQGCLTLFATTDPRCITQMNKNVVAYAKTGSLKQHADEISQTYTLALQVLGPIHSTTVSSRFYYHKLLLEQDRYLELIPVVIETIEAERALQNDEFRILEWEILLYGLYVVENQSERQIPTLKRIMAITERIIGVDSENFRRAATVLADQYCMDKLYNEFFALTARYQLDNKCLSKTAH